MSLGAMNIDYCNLSEFELTELHRNNMITYNRFWSNSDKVNYVQEDDHSRRETAYTFPWLNQVQHVKIMENPEKRINEIVSNLIRKGYKSISWLILPFDQPENLDKLLLDFGFKPFWSNMYLMFSNINQVKEQKIPDLEIKPVRSEEEMRIFFDFWVEVYKSLSGMAEYMYQMECDCGYTSKLPRQNFIGYLSGEPVSVSTLLMDGKVAGVYSVSTRKDVDSWEKIDAAVGRYPLQTAKSQRYRVGVAQTGEGGLERYRRYGFIENKNLCYNSFIYSVE